MLTSARAKGRWVTRVFWRRRQGAIQRFQGSAEAICRQIIEVCWNGRYLQTGLGNYLELWVRDLGVCTAALCRIGARDRARASWVWALDRFARTGRITTTITQGGRPVNFPFESHDALPWILHALCALGDRALLEKYRPFLESQIQQYAETIVDTATGALRRAFAGIRDLVRYQASAYNTVMLGMLSRDLQILGLPNPFRAFDYGAILLQRFWTGTHFRADAIGDHFSSEANLFPFWTGLVDDAARWGKIHRTFHALGLTLQYPVRYAPEMHVFSARWDQTFILRNYQGTTIWTWLGAIYLQLAKRYGSPGRAKEEDAFRSMIERYGTFPEVLNPDGSWYRTTFYSSDEGMLWAALYLDLIS